MLNQFAFAHSLAVLTATLYVLFGVLALVSPRAFQLLFNAQFFGADVAALLPKVTPSLRKSRSEGTSRSRRGFEDHAIPLTLQELNGAIANSLHMATLVVVGPRLVVGGVTRQQMIRGDEHGMGHGDDRLLMAAMPHRADIGPQRRPSSRGCRPASAA